MPVDVDVPPLRPVRQRPDAALIASRMSQLTAGHPEQPTDRRPDGRRTRAADPVDDRRRGRTLSAVQRFVVGQLRREQAAGTISPTVDVDLVAEVWVRLSASFLAIPSHVVDLDDPEQLRGIARNYLVPMLTG
jgi:hypothetical protein